MAVLTFKEYQKRIGKLPQKTGILFENGSKQHIENVKEVLETGIKKNNFGLAKLSPMTKKIREAKGEIKSEVPLRGNDGMIKNLEATKSKQSWILSPNNKFATSKNFKGKGKRISWRRIWTIQEYGAKIPVSPRMRGYFYEALSLNLGKGPLVIPKRPAMQKAFQRYIRSLLFKNVNNSIAEGMRKHLEGST